MLCSLEQLTRCVAQSGLKGHQHGTLFQEAPNSVVSCGQYSLGSCFYGLWSVTLYYCVGIALNLLLQPRPPATSLCHLVNGLLSEEPWDVASDFLLEVMTAFFLSIQTALIVLPRSMAFLLLF